MKYYCEKPNGVRENYSQDLKVTMKVDRKNNLAKIVYMRDSQ